MTFATIDEVSGTDAALAAVLAEAGLPTDDLAQSGRRYFRFTEAGRLIGYIGWEELDGRSVLLRSLLIMPAERRHGWGACLTDWALRRLAELGFTDVWVLTTSAERLALRQGFERAARETAPDTVRATRQFAGLCPSSAIVLHRSLP